MPTHMYALLAGSSRMQEEISRRQEVRGSEKEKRRQELRESRGMER